VKVLDINGFIGKWPYWPVPATEPAEVRDFLDRWNVSQACICSTRSLFVNWQDGNCETLATAQQDSHRFIPFACLGTYELSHHAATEKHDLGRYLKRGFLGFRLYPQHHSYHPLYESFVDDICEQAIALRTPVLLSLRTIMNWGVPAQPLEHVVALVERHPKVSWILSGVNYLHEIRAAVVLLKKFESVHLETSCVMGYHAIDKLVDECGHGQILFGSAAPLQHLGANLEKVTNSDISDDAKEAVLAGNASRLLTPLPQ
jgi:predicted TIM-barrel fold metal-dependent hydrolase